MIRLGLCCIFREEPIRFRRTTATALRKLTADERAQKLSEICRDNAEALLQAIHYCEENQVGAFRVNSQILPLKTHPEMGYALEELPDGESIRALFDQCGKAKEEAGLRLSFHPDQFVVLNSPRPDVMESSVRELVYQAEVAEWVGADVINLHGGGAYGDKPAALERLVRVIETLPLEIRTRLTLENDDRTYTPKELLPVCNATGVPLVYDVHHHRCLPDGLTVAAATDAARKTWSREPLFHLSSPRDGWEQGVDWKPHHDFIDPADFPVEWKELELTVDVEAKAKELAVHQLRSDLAQQGVAVWS
jgi:UV DNA damage endonuclease